MPNTDVWEQAAWLYTRVVTGYHQI